MAVFDSDKLLKMFKGIYIWMDAAIIP